MIINLNHKQTQPQPGETRTIRRFAWLPKQFGTQVKWLGWYTELQGWYYKDYSAIVPDGEGKPVHKGFRVGKWEFLSASIK